MNYNNEINKKNGNNEIVEPSPGPAILPESEEHGPSSLYGKPLACEPNYLNETTKEVYKKYGSFKFESS